MTIRKGEPWGVDVERPAGLLVCGSDRELAAAIAASTSSPLGLAGGDLHRSVGSPPDRNDMQRLPIDVIEVTADGVRHLAVAHVVVRRAWWRGPVLAVMNVDHVGARNVAPRAHPNDGRLDVVEVRPSMPLRQRLQAARRLEQGTHVPHPHIDVRRVTHGSWTFPRPMRVWIDGERVDDAREVAVSIRPDAAAVHV